MNIDLSTLEAKLAEVLSKELDDAIPDGMVQNLTAELIRVVGETLVATAAALKTA